MAMEAMDVKKIAIIGGGPSGLVSLNEFIHTSSDGSSTLRSLDSQANDLPKHPAFEEVVVFEQNRDLGGVWLYNEQSDPEFPGTENYSDPFSVRPTTDVPSNEDLRKYTKNNPLQIPRNVEQHPVCEWKTSAVYSHLFTNVPNRVMRFSSGFDIEVEGTGPESNIFYPFVKHQHVLEYLEKFVELNNLSQHIRFNSTVEKVYKIESKWIVVVKQTDNINNVDSWYVEEFDAVVCAVGRFNVPFIPEIENLNEFNNNNPGVLSHTKAFRTESVLQNKKVLLVGGNVSAVDILQYLIPVCEEVWLSTNSTTNTIIDEPDNWVSRILNDESLKITKCARIKRFIGNDVEFEDGSVATGFDKIIFATGYHLSYPFLNVPENKDKSYVKLCSGSLHNPNYALTRAANIYLHTFTIGEPTLTHIGICQTPFLFFGAESNAIAMAGVWSKFRKLPPVADQKLSYENSIKNKTSKFQVYNDFDVIQYIQEMYKLGPSGRVDLTQLIVPGEIKESRMILNQLFYKFASGELRNDV